MCADSCGGTSDIGNIRLVEPRHTINDGTVQICNQFMHDNKLQLSWCYQNSTESWNTTAARVACRQLGLPHSGKPSNHTYIYVHAVHVLILNNSDILQLPLQPWLGLKYRHQIT